MIDLLRSTALSTDGIAGGISETKRMAAMAEAYDVAIAPHCPIGPVSAKYETQMSSLSETELLLPRFTTDRTNSCAIDCICGLPPTRFVDSELRDPRNVVRYALQC